MTVKFELANVPFTLPEITVPVVGSEYVRLPIQFGMKGFVIAANAYLGGVSGLGGGAADLTGRPNLANLAFVPIGNRDWSATLNPNALDLYGPEGVILRAADEENGATIKRVLAGSASVGPVTIPGNSGAAFTISVPGAQAGDTVMLGHSVTPGFFAYTPYVSAPGVVTVNVANVFSLPQVMPLQSVTATVVGTQ